MDRYFRDALATPTWCCALGLAGAPAEIAIDANSSLEELLAYAGESEPGFEMMNTMLDARLEPIQGVETSVEVIKGIDGNDITLFIHRPEGATGPLPGVLHLHGGGMVILEAAGPGYARWRSELAASPAAETSLWRQQCRPNVTAW